MIPFWIVALIIGVVVIVGLIVVLQVYKKSIPPSPGPKIEDTITFGNVIIDNPSIYALNLPSRVKDSKTPFLKLYPKSISSGLTISGKGTIDWGDGAISEYDGTDVEIAHDYNVSSIYTVKIEGVIVSLRTNASQGGGPFINIITSFMNMNAPNLETLTVSFDNLNSVEPIIGLEKSPNLNFLDIMDSVGFSLYPGVILDEFYLTSSMNERALISIGNIDSCNVKNLRLVNQAPSENPSSTTQIINLSNFTQMESLDFYLDYVYGITFSELQLPLSPLLSISVISSDSFPVIDNITVNGNDFVDNGPTTLIDITLEKINYLNDRSLDFTRYSNLENLSLYINENTNSLNAITLPNNSLTLDLNIENGSSIKLNGLNTEGVKSLGLVGDFILNGGSPNENRLELDNAQQLSNLSIFNNLSLTTINLDTNDPLDFTNGGFYINDNSALTDIILGGTLNITGLFQVYITNNASLEVNDGSNNNSNIDYIGSSLALQAPQPTPDDGATVQISGNLGNLNIVVAPWSILSSGNWTVSNI